MKGKSPVLILNFVIDLQVEWIGLVELVSTIIHLSSFVSMILLPVGTYVIQILKDQVYHCLFLLIGITSGLEG